MDLADLVLFAGRGDLTAAHQELKKRSLMQARVGSRLRLEMHCHTVYLACQRAVIDDAT
jgi:hypothetical protein